MLYLPHPWHMAPQNIVASLAKAISRGTALPRKAAAPVAPPLAGGGGKGSKTVTVPTTAAAAAVPEGATPRSMFRLLTTDLAPATPSTYAVATAGASAAAESSTPISTPGGLETSFSSMGAGSTPHSVVGSTPGSAAAGVNLSMLSVVSTPGAGAAVGASPGHFLAVARAAKAARVTALAAKSARAMLMPPPARPAATTKRKQKKKKEPTSLPPEHTNALFTSFASMGPSPEAKQAVQAGLEQLFEQLVGDLSAFAKHAGRITIEEDDVKLLMNRQRITMGQKGRSLHDLARQYLPLESVEQLIPVARASDVTTPPNHFVVR